MQIAAMNWQQVEAQLARDDRCVLPIGSVEQHAQLSLATDVILAERVSLEAAEPLGIPVFPPLAYGFTPTLTAYPGTLTLKLTTLLTVVRELVLGLHDQGFRRVVIVNGHGGNNAVGSLIAELQAEVPTLQCKLHNWWNAPRTLGVVKSVDADSAHASWMERLPWTTVAGAEAPEGRKPPVDYKRYGLLNPAQARELAGDGNFGGAWVRPDDDALRMWAVAVEETRAVLEGPWR